MRIFVIAALAALAAGAACVSPASAESARPQFLPTRDVDVTYSIVQGKSTLPQRVRWLAARRLLRVDPPVDGMYMIVDYDAKHMSMVREAQHAALEMNAPDGIALGVQNRLDATTRGSDERIAGLTCTNWQTTDLSNRPATVCLTPDGVLLQVRSQGRIVLTADQVRYGPQQAALFQVPDGFLRVPAGKVLDAVPGR